jgi:hypothetical protein
VRHFLLDPLEFHPVDYAIAYPTPVLVQLGEDELMSSDDAEDALEDIARLRTFLDTAAVYPFPSDSIPVWEGIAAAESVWTARFNDPPGPFTVVEPAHGARVRELAPEIRWTHAIDPDTLEISTYRLVMAADSGFQSIVADTAGLTDVRWTPPSDLDPDQTYWWRVQAIDPKGDSRWMNELAAAFTVDTTRVVSSPAPNASSAVRLVAVPNPANPSVTLRIQAPSDASGTVDVFDVTGRLVRSFTVPPGVREVRWDGRDTGGREAASGVYRVLLRVGREARVRTVTLLR